MKKQLIKKIFVGLAVFILARSASATLNSDGDFQYWSTEAVEGKINDQWKVYVEEEFRFGDDASKFYYHHTQLEPGYKVNDWLEIAPAYRQVWELDTKLAKKDHWFEEERPMFNVTVKHKWNGWEISDRNRFEYRFFEIKEDRFRYRNKITLKSPWKWTSWNINPFIADEIFVEEGVTGTPCGYNRNRLYGGVGFQIISHLKGELFYLWQSKDSVKDNWIDFNVIGTKLKFEF
ncbi:MAG: DUF2490 domain-containing protein [Chlamydiae bacterium]|nr:DUF2490 domain-containing protein [Chlamydiota bacterium]MBI3277095.1 DUF2490 domain-containing protein [Chlamydiota bacterium]